MNDLIRFVIVLTLLLPTSSYSAKKTFKQMRSKKDNSPLVIEDRNVSCQYIANQDDNGSLMRSMADNFICENIVFDGVTHPTVFFRCGSLKENFETLGLPSTIQKDSKVVINQRLLLALDPETFEPLACGSKISSLIMKKLMGR